MAGVPARLVIKDKRPFRKKQKSPGGVRPRSGPPGPQDDNGRQAPSKAVQICAISQGSREYIQDDSFFVPLKTPGCATIPKSPPEMLGTSSKNPA